jgi:hypothetical protein
MIRGKKDEPSKKYVVKVKTEENTAKYSKPVHSTSNQKGRGN